MQLGVACAGAQQRLRELEVQTSAREAAREALEAACAKRVLALVTFAIAQAKTHGIDTSAAEAREGDWASTVRVSSGMPSTL